jgi:hypothetical protein
VNTGIQSGGEDIMTRGKVHKSPKVKKPRKTPAEGETKTVEPTVARSLPSGAGVSSQRVLGRGLAAKKVIDERRAVLDDADMERNGNGNGNGHRPAIDPTGNEVENGPEVDPSDPNLSAALVDADGGDMNEALGLRGEDTMELDDPEEMDEEREEGDERDTDMPGAGRG